MGLLAIDIGGTSIKFGVWDQEMIKEQGSVPTPKNWVDMEATLLVIKEQLSQNYELTGVGFSCPGVVNKSARRIEVASALPFMAGFPICDVLEKSFGIPVAIENDANCAGLAEVWQGAAKGCQDVLFVVLGTGIGGAVIVDGKIREGRHLFGGEFGMMLLQDDQEFSHYGSAVVMAKTVSEQKGLSGDQALSGEAVFALAEQGDDWAKKAVERFYHYLAVGIYNLAYCFDPEKIILGGGVSAKPDLISAIEAKIQVIRDRTPYATFMPDLAPCMFQNDANLIGAVANFIQAKNEAESV
ncbi:ROK family protein [Carnobacterium gallinarum]|uniref:ROK family protein n=1 Tax=Carnobacterium gallinarum TaxID=2749 RepID=UPI0005595F9C|nr:ROK family protein [Carnobacterium gallinarum]